MARGEFDFSSGLYFRSEAPEEQVNEDLLTVYKFAQDYILLQMGVLNGNGLEYEVPQQESNQSSQLTGIQREVKKIEKQIIREGGIKNCSPATYDTYVEEYSYYDRVRAANTYLLE